jgi:hypothetical protein
MILGVEKGDQIDVSQLLNNFFSDINVGYENKVPINMTVTIKNYKHSNLQPKTISVDRNAIDLYQCNIVQYG